MDITPYIDSLRRDLLTAAEAAGPDAQAVVERLTFALEPAARLALMEAVSQAASEITAELPAGNVEVRLSGRELEFGVQAPPPPAAAPPPPPPPAPPQEVESDEDGTIARITLRLPESLKARAEEAADSNGQSLNNWLVGVVRKATREGRIDVDVDLSGIPQIVNEAMSGFDPFRDRGQRRMTGWL